MTKMTKSAKAKRIQQLKCGTTRAAKRREKRQPLRKWVNNERVKRNDRKIDELFKIMEEENPLSRLIIKKSAMDSAVMSLQNACATEKILMKFTKYGGGYALEIDGEVFAKEQYPDLSTAQSELPEIAMNKLKEICFVLEKKPTQKENFIQITSLDNLPSFKEDESIEYKPTEDIGEKQTIPDQFQTNPGYQMLLKMGWSGKGLGSSEQGMVNPVKLKERDILTGNPMVHDAEEMFKNYHKSNCIQPLMFDIELDKNQRANLHKLSSKCGLTSKSVNIENTRMFTVSKRLDTKGIIENLIKNGGENPFYKLHIPTKFQHLFENY